jgi:hypothetical protein
MIAVILTSEAGCKAKRASVSSEVSYESERARNSEVEGRLEGSRYSRRA